MQSKSQKRHGVLAGAALAGAAAIFVSNHSASAALVIDYPGTGITVTDNGPGDSDPAVGTIINSTNVAGFGVAITVAFSDSPGTATSGDLQIQSLDIQNNNPNAATLNIRVSDTGFTSPGGAGTGMSLISSVGGTFNLSAPTDLATFQSFADPNNGQPAGPVSTAVLAFVHGAVPNFSGSDSVGWTRNAGPYSLTNLTTTTLSPGAQLNISGTSTTVAVPEPAMLGVGALVAAGLLGRRRREDVAAK